MANYKITFTRKGAPQAWDIYRSLTKLGVNPSEIDQGYHIINPSQTSCAAGEAVCVRGTSDFSIDQREVFDFLFRNYERFGTLFKTNDLINYERFGTFLERKEVVKGASLWPIEEFASEGLSAKTLRSRSEKAIATLKEILKKQGVAENSARYREGLAMGLFHLVMTPGREEVDTGIVVKPPHYNPFARAFDEYEAKQKALIDARNAALNALGLSEFAAFVEKNGGIRGGWFANFAIDEHHSASYCAQDARLLVSIYQMANLEPEIVRVDLLRSKISPKASPEMRSFWTKALTAPVHPHMCVGVNIEGSMRLFDPSMNEWKAETSYTSFYPLSWRQDLSNILVNAANQLVWDRYDFISDAYSEGHGAIDKTTEREISEKEKEALEYFRKALELDPDNAYAYLMRGYFRTGKDSEENAGIADFNKALEINDFPWAALFYRGLITIRRAATKKSPHDDASIGSLKAFCLELKKGITDLSNAVKANPPLADMVYKAVPETGLSLPLSLIVYLAVLNASGRKEDAIKMLQVMAGKPEAQDEDGIQMPKKTQRELAKFIFLELIPKDLQKTSAFEQLMEKARQM